jgi:hypothetical protein
MQVRYVGMFEEVIVPEVSTTETVKRATPVEVDDALAARLLAQRGFNVRNRTGSFRTWQMAQRACAGR